MFYQDALELFNLSTITLIYYLSGSALVIGSLGIHLGPKVEDKKQNFKRFLLNSLLIFNIYHNQQSNYLITKRICLILVFVSLYLNCTILVYLNFVNTIFQYILLCFCFYLKGVICLGHQKLMGQLFLFLFTIAIQSFYSIFFLVQLMRTIIN